MMKSGLAVLCCALHDSKLTNSQLPFGAFRQINMSRKPFEQIGRRLQHIIRWYFTIKMRVQNH